MKKLVYLIAVLFFVSCAVEKSSTYKEMKSDVSMSEFFTDSELQDLAKIVDFFDSEIHLDKSKPKDEAYFEFNKNIIEECINEIKGFKIPLNYKLQEEVYSKIDTAFFKEIWVHKTFYKGSGMEKPILEKAYDLNLFGKYMLFLKSLKNEDVLFRDFYKRFSLSNEISFGVQSAAFYQFEMKEFKGIKRRMFFAVYYLTVNDKMHNYINRKS
ncbi:hypothetical protein SAMN05216503_2607 [Polaribacter sp. KT25b]|uniref:hypothetical protein n=1 Tax=Polaribacter sp. KT25b TaxID=1855336 RepID=UPI00087DBF40|nr:hypothetical protein [Polaribacter sp. KT25b]SDS29777.1 hypothetical protein SAMN05216503_2607 [Polaribacter sp. KT25b]